MDKFLAKHSDKISSRIPDYLDLKRKGATTRDVLDDFYDEVERILVKYEIADSPALPHVSFNMDESGVCINPKNVKVIGELSKLSKRIMFFNWQLTRYSWPDTKVHIRDSF